MNCTFWGGITGRNRNKKHDKSCFVFEFHDDTGPKSHFVFRLYWSPAIIFCFLLLTFGRAPWLSQWQIPQHSWSTPSRRPVPRCVARKWLFHLGCRPQSEAELDVFQSHVTIFRHPLTHPRKFKLMCVVLRANHKLPHNILGMLFSHLIALCLKNA